MQEENSVDLDFNSQEEKQEVFNEFIEDYKAKGLKEKQNIIMEEFKELTALITKLLNDENIKYDIILNKEILDLKNENYTEDDFSEAVYVYLHMFKDAFATYMLKKLDD